MRPGLTTRHENPGRLYHEVYELYHVWKHASEQKTTQCG